jgi:hypothetical protein
MESLNLLAAIDFFVFTSIFFSFPGKSAWCHCERLLVWFTGSSHLTQILAACWLKEGRKTPRLSGAL